MTNPAWVVLFTKIAGLVTDTGGTTSHPAVLAREFGIPAVIGTSVATQRIVDRRPAPGRRHRRQGRDPARRAAVQPARTGPASTADRSALRGSTWRPRRSSRAASWPTRSRTGSSRTSSSGDYPPDSRIVETQVARELGTSQAPVREALRGLEALGVVEITPFRGARVRRPSKREIIEAYAVRSALEALAARLAVPRMTDADLAELAGYLEAMRAAARDGDGHARRPGRRPVPQPDRRARRATARSSASGARSSRSRGPTSPWPFPAPTRTWSADLHAPILAALERRDVEAIVAALRRALRRGQRQHGKALAGRRRHGPTRHDLPHRAPST